MTDHTVKAYDQELHELTQLITKMGLIAEQQIHDSIRALVAHDEKLANDVAAADDQLDDLQHRIEALTIQLIGKRQPMASDLRDIVGALRISIDLERVGDFAKNIGKRVFALGDDLYPRDLMRRVQQMADLAAAQIKNVLDSYAERNDVKAMAVWKSDEEIDAMYTSLFRELLTYMMEEPRNITFSTHLLFCAKNIERIGDHATNIAEIVHYMIEGIPLKDGRPKGDKAASAGSVSTA